MEPFSIQESIETRNEANIKVVGIGGGGSNTINHMHNEGVAKIELVVANTDSQALASSPVNSKIHLGEKLTRGLGAGMKPSVGQAAAEESYEDVKKRLDKSDVVFIAAGLGGGTGTGAAPIIAKAAKEAGALTIAVTTRPFRFEGKKRARLAAKGLEELKAECDSIVVIPNDKLLDIAEKSMGIKESFRMVDDVLHQAVSGMSGVILNYGDNDINVDFADVKTVMQHKGLALMGIGQAQGENAAADALRHAIESPLLDNMSLHGAMGVLVNFHIHPDFSLHKMTEAMDIVYDSADEEADIIFGTITDDSYDPDFVKITIIATGFEKVESEPATYGSTATTSAEPAPKPVQQTLPDIDPADLEIPTFMRNQ